MKNKSIWNEEKYLHNFDKPFDTDTFDILIIGGGMAGLHSAYFLKDSKKKIALIDKGKLASGVTSKTTGKITYLQDLVYQNLEKMYDKNISYTYYRSQKKAISLLLSIIQKQKIDCDLQKVISYTFSNEKPLEKEFERERDLLKEFDSKIDTLKKFPLSIPYLYSISAGDTYVFHPLKYLYKLIDILKEKIFFYENVTAHSIRKKEDLFWVETSKGILKARKIIVTTHYPFFIVPGFIPLKTHIENAYALAIKEKNQNFSAISYKKNIKSFRFQRDFLIYGGHSHSFSKSYDIEKEKDAFLDSFHSFSEKKIEYLWDTHDIMTDDFMPFAGEIQPNLYIATGFNKWGMTNSVISAKIIIDSILNAKNDFQYLFDPKRHYNLRRSLSFTSNLCKTGKTYICTKLDRYKKSVGCANVVKENGVWYGIYKDEKGIEHKVYNKCPHMGCSLTFNHFDKTWDCPCHGSRFGIDGDLVEGPSTYSIAVKKNTN